jgi:hypothetical protein
LDCGGLTPLWIFPSTRSIPIQSSVKPEHSRTPSFPQNVLGDCSTWARELTENLLLPFLRAFASSRETLPQGLRQTSRRCPAGFSPDTSAATFPPKSTFAFTLQVKPGKFQNPFHGPLDQPPWTTSNFSTAAYRLMLLIGAQSRSLIVMRHPMVSNLQPLHHQPAAQRLSSTMRSTECLPASRSMLGRFAPGTNRATGSHR